MAIQSGGVLVKTPSLTMWQGSPSTWNLEMSGWWASYACIYKQQPYVAAVVDKIAKGTARLPLKVYRRNADGREEIRDHPYAQLLRRPNSRHDPFFFWLWTVSTYNVYGEVFWGKVRDKGGRPIELLPMHPVNMTLRDGQSPESGVVYWRYDNGSTVIPSIPDYDLVQFRTYNPDTTVRGLSPLEPLRRTLENEDAARRATSAFWRNGARPAVTLTHPGNLSESAAERLSIQWNGLAAGADNTGKTLVLEEGMVPNVISLSAEEAQYIETRKFNREEVCAVYDMPPPVVHILDHATFSNITEQMRSLYRDTMAPRLSALESALDHQLRGGMVPGRTEPDFGEDVYAEFLMDEVLRGDFETRTDAYQKMINSGWGTVNEVRKFENLPPVEGGDVPLINSTLVPLERALAPPPEPAPPAPPQLMPPDTPMPADVMRTVMGRLSRPKSLDEIDPDALVKGLNGHAERVLGELEMAKLEGDTVEGFRNRLKTHSETRDPMLEVAKEMAEAVKSVSNQPSVTIAEGAVQVSVDIGELAADAIAETTKAQLAGMGEVRDAVLEAIDRPLSVTVEAPPVTVETPPPRSRRVERDEDGNITRIVEE